jgi:hypothetical protein
MKLGKDMQKKLDLVSKAFTLVLIVENNQNLGVISGVTPEPLEAELIKCIRSWNKTFPLMDIIMYCPTHRSLPQNIIDIASKFGRYIHKEDPDTKEFQSGYMNIPVGLYHSMADVTTPYVVHIDLDMTILNPKQLIDYLYSFLHDYTQTPIIGRLNDKERKRLTNPPWLTRPDFNFESNFIIASKKFFELWYYEAMILNSKSDELARFEIPEVEEWAIDILNTKIRINPIIDYQVGTRYPAENIKNYSQVIFHHNHVYEPTKELDNYFKNLVLYLDSDLSEITNNSVLGIDNTFTNGRKDVHTIKGIYEVH